MLTYNIPTSMIREYGDKTVIIRSEDPGELLQAVARIDRTNLECVQLLGAAADPESLSKLDKDIPIEILLKDWQRDAGNLHAYSKLASQNRMRVSISVSPGFMNALEIALSLKLDTKLEVGQLDDVVMQELEVALNRYLHDSTVASPVEFFHSILLAFCHDNTVLSLWTIQDEDPEKNRYVLEDGRIVLSDRLRIEMPDGPNDFLDDYRYELLSEQGECSICRYFTNCAGYFKFPDKGYSCKAVQNVFEGLKHASNEIKAFHAEIHEPHDCGCSCGEECSEK